MSRPGLDVRETEDTRGIRGAPNIIDIPPQGSNGVVIRQAYERGPSEITAELARPDGDLEELRLTDMFGRVGRARDEVGAMRPDDGDVDFEVGLLIPA